MNLELHTVQHDADQAQLHRCADKTLIVYTPAEEGILINAVVGTLDSALEWAESQEVAVSFIGREGFFRVLSGRAGWNCEKACVGTFTPEQKRD